MPTTVDDMIAKANDDARQRRESASADEKLAKAELKKRKAEQIASIPAIPLCPCASRIGAQVYCDISKPEGVDKALKIWEWWRQITRDYPDRITTYFTRLHPAKVPKPRGERSEEVIHGFPEYGWENEYSNLENWILQRFGSGNYRLYINDATLGCQLVVWTINGIWNPDYLPVIDPKEVDVEHPNNTSYVAELRRRKIIAGFEEKQSVPAEPSVQSITAAAQAAAQQQANSGLAAIVNPLVNTVKELATADRHKEVDTPAVVAKVLDVVVDGIKQAQAVQVNSTDPSTHVRQLIEISKAMAPPQVDIAGIMRENARVQEKAAESTQKLAEELRQRDAEERKALRDELREMKHRPTEDPLAPMRNGIEMMKQMKELMGMAGGEEGEEKNPKGEPWYADILKTLVPALAPVVGIGAQALAKYLTAPAPNAIPQQQMTNPASAQQQSQIPQQQQPQQEHQEEMNRERMLWMAIGGKLQHDYVNGKSGVDFALWMIDQTHMGLNRLVYDQIASLGRDAVLLSMQTYAPMVWQQVSGPDGKPQPGFSMFLDQFLDQQAVSAALSGETPTEPIEPEIVTDIPQVPRRKRVVVS